MFATHRTRRYLFSPRRTSDLRQLSTATIGSPLTPVMTSELALPLTVLVFGASDDSLASLHSALPDGEAEIEQLTSFAGANVNRDFLDLFIVDVSTDEEGGRDIIGRARHRWPTAGICCVGCRDVVPLLEAGADDAVPLDAPREVVVAQIAAAARRARIASAQLRVAYGDVVYDREARRVWCAGREISLTPRELRLFDILFRRAGVPVSVDTLHDYVWSDESPVSNALAVYVSYLRRKLADSRLAAVETMRGVGYRLTRKTD